MRLSTRRSRTLTPKIDHLEERFVLSTLVAGAAVPSPTAHGGWVAYGRNSASTAIPVRSQGLVNGGGASLAHRGGFANSVIVARLTASNAADSQRHTAQTSALGASGVFTASAGSNPVHRAMRSSNAGTAPTEGGVVAGPASRAGSSVTRSAAASTPGAIRRLALAPGANRSAARDSTLDFTTMSGSGGGYPPAYYPTLFGSGGGQGANLAPGEDPLKPKHWLFGGPAPVGAILSFWLGNIDTTKVASYAWDGGSDIKSYFAGSGEDASYLHSYVSMTPGVLKNQAGYTFIVPATAAVQNYTVTVTIKYKPEASGTAPDSVLDCTFSTVSPVTATLAVAHTGAPQGDLDGGLLRVGLWITSPGLDDPTSGIKITASTKAAPSVGGSFMFLQLVKPKRSLSTMFGGVTKTRTMSPIDERVNPPVYGSVGWNLDDGGDGATGYFVSGSNPGKHQWSLIAGETGSAKSMWDSPQSFYASGDVSNLTIGNRNAGGSYSPENFVTYLMYQPPGGVWVALYKVEWSFGISVSATQGPGDVTTIHTDSVTNLVANGSSAVGEWPSWIGRVSRVGFQ